MGAFLHVAVGALAAGGANVGVLDLHFFDFGFLDGVESSSSSSFFLVDSLLYHKSL